MTATTPVDTWNARDYGDNARFVADLAADLVDWLDPKPGERIMDLGCGDGALTQAIVDRGADVVGVDASPSLLAAASDRGIDTRLGDGQCLDDIDDLVGPFDAVFSNAALHWMAREPVAVINGVTRRLKPGGRYVAEMGAAGNIAPIRDTLRAETRRRGLDPDTLDPWYFPSEETFLCQLTDAGFNIRREHCFERPTSLPGDVSDWLTTLAGPFVTAMDAGEPRESFVADVRSRLTAVMTDADGHWTAPYVRLRFVAVKD